MNDNLFTIELGEKHIRIGDIKLTGGKVEILSFGYEDAPLDVLSADTEINLEKQATVVEKLISSLKIKKKNVNVIIPDGNTFSQVVEMPKLNEKELLSAIRYQADQFVPMPIEEITLDIEVLQEDPKLRKLLLLIVAAPKKTASIIEKIINRLNLNPVALENELSAVSRFCSQLIKPASKGGYVVLNLGYNNSSIYLFNGQNLLLANRTVKFGLNLFIKDVMVNLSLESETQAWDLLRQGETTGGSAPVNIEVVVEPLLKELYGHLEKFIMLAKDKYQLPVTEMRLFNYSEVLGKLDAKISAAYNLPVKPLLSEDLLTANPVASTFKNEKSTLVSVIGGNLR